jgi:hypothetical protein
MSLGRKTQSKTKAPSRETAAKAEAERMAEAAKITRLRALRLAKEAAERAAVPPAAVPKRGQEAVRARRANGANQPG